MAATDAVGGVLQFVNYDVRSGRLVTATNRRRLRVPDDLVELLEGRIHAVRIAAHELAKDVRSRVLTQKLETALSRLTQLYKLLEA